MTNRELINHLMNQALDKEISIRIIKDDKSMEKVNITGFSYSISVRGESIIIECEY